MKITSSLVLIKKNNEKGIMHYTICQHSMYFVLNDPTLFFLVFQNKLLILLWLLVA
jgi:hypothetical protein